MPGETVKPVNDGTQEEIDRESINHYRELQQVAIALATAIAVEQPHPLETEFYAHGTN